MSQQILLTLNDTAGNALGQYNINTAGSALHIQAVDGAYYQFTDPMTGIGPEGIITEREGDNLLVSFDEGTDLVIENYFAQNEPGALVGMQADGGLFSYPVATAPEHVLAEEIAASQALGSEQPVWAPLGVLGAVGLVAAGIGHRGEHAQAAHFGQAIEQAVTPGGLARGGFAQPYGFAVV